MYEHFIPGTQIYLRVETLAGLLPSCVYCVDIDIFQMFENNFFASTSQYSHVSNKLKVDSNDGELGTDYT